MTYSFSIDEKGKKFIVVDDETGKILFNGGFKESLKELAIRILLEEQKNRKRNGNDKDTPFK